MGTINLDVDITLTDGAVDSTLAALATRSGLIVQNRSRETVYMRWSTGAWTAGATEDFFEIRPLEVVQFEGGACPFDAPRFRYDGAGDPARATALIHVIQLTLV